MTHHDTKGRYIGTGLATPEQARHKAQQMLHEYYNPAPKKKKFRVRYVARISMWVVEYGHTYMAQRQTWQEAMNFVSYQTGRYRRVEAI